MIYDCQTNTFPPEYPCQCFDANTGELVKYVTRYDTETHAVQRIVLNDAGDIVLNHDGTTALRVDEIRPLRFVPVDKEEVAYVIPDPEHGTAKIEIRE